MIIHDQDNTYRRCILGSKIVDWFSIVDIPEQEQCVDVNVQDGLGHAQTLVADKVSHIVNSQIRHDRSSTHCRLKKAKRSPITTLQTNKWH